MQTTMDKAGRIIIPAALRAQLGLVPGPVDIYTDGANIVIEVVADEDNVVEEDGLLVIAADGAGPTDDELRELRLAFQP